MSQTNVRAALVAAFRTGNFFADTKVAWENVPFTPPTGEPWAAFYFVPSQPSVATLGPNGQDHLDGFVQIDLNFPTGKGEKDSFAKYEAIKNSFTAGSYLIYQGQVVTIKSCGRSPGRVVNNVYKVIVTIYFYAHINR